MWQFHLNMNIERRQIISQCMRPDYRSGPSLVMIGKKTVTCAKDRLTNRLNAKVNWWHPVILTCDLEKSLVLLSYPQAYNIKYNCCICISWNAVVTIPKFDHAFCTRTLISTALNKYSLYWSSSNEKWYIDCALKVFRQSATSHLFITRCFSWEPSDYKEVLFISIMWDVITYPCHTYVHHG